MFRRHVGAAFLTRDQLDLGTWGVKSSASADVRQAEAAHEREVSAHLGRTKVWWVAVADEPGKTSLRSVLERNSVALLSNRRHPLDPPSPSWLGLNSDRAEIRESGLWNVDYVDDAYDSAFLDTFEELTTAMCSRTRK